MDIKNIETEIQKHHIRSGMLKKRSKFLKEWRDRWVVLTSHFIFTFTDKKMRQVTDILEIKQIEGLKSYLKNSDDVTANGFKVQSSENTLILQAADLEEKWSWLVTIERLVDYRILKQTGQCKNIQDVSKLGFKSFNQFQEQRGGPSQQKEQQQTDQEGKKDNFQEVKKLVEFIKSQQQEVEQLRNKICAQFEQIQPNSTQVEGIDTIAKDTKQYCQETKGIQIEAVIKGMLIGKKLEKSGKVEYKQMLDLLLNGCSSEKAENWAEQLKQIL